MKKLLYITAFPPNNKTGGQIFSLNSIMELSKEYEVILFYFDYPDHTCEIIKHNNIKEIKEFSVKKFDFLRKFWIHPIFTRRFNISILRQLQLIANDYDILYFDFSQVAIYSLYIKHPYKILRMHDVLYQKFSRKNKILTKWVINTEKKILESFSKVFVPSKKDVDLLKKVYGVNALYTNEYLKPVQFPKEFNQKNLFIFYGYWKRSENTDGLIWFIKNVLPLLKIRLNIAVIGGGLPDEINKNYLIPNSIKYMGFVENPLEIIMQSAAVFVPLFQGAGIKVKVIDSFTVGTPVIGTYLAFEGLPDISGMIYCNNDAESFASAIIEFKPLTYKEKMEKAKEFDSIYNKHHLFEQI